MSKTLEQILHYENMLRVIEGVKEANLDGILPAELFHPTDRTQGATGTYTKVTSNRQVAQQVMYGSPSRNVNLSGISKVAVHLIHTYEHFNHEPTTLDLLRSIHDEGAQRWGTEIVGRKVREFARRYTNLRRAAWFSALTTGQIHFDSDGNLLASASGAAITIDFGVPAGNKGQLNWDGNGDIITTAWSDETADITGNLQELKQAAVALTGYEIKYAFYGKNIPGYLAKNTVFKEYLTRNPGFNQGIVEGSIPDGVYGLHWRDASTAHYVDKDGNVHFFWGDDTIVFTPDPNDEGWFGFVEGSFPVPTTVGAVAGDATIGLGKLRTVFGMFSYCRLQDDPPRLTQYGGDTFLPVIIVPASIFIADVTP